ncbi:MAG TPA: hypothetical protein P5048_00965 [Chlamydiales bacterium]|nr:hypothetical protein [Chlamydiales bacterium]
MENFSLPHFSGIEYYFKISKAILKSDFSENPDEKPSFLKKLIVTTIAAVTIPLLTLASIFYNQLIINIKFFAVIICEFNASGKLYGFDQDDYIQDIQKHLLTLTYDILFSWIGSFFHNLGYAFYGFQPQIMNRFHSKIKKQIA